MAANASQGVTFRFIGSGWSRKATGLSWSGESRGAIDITTLESEEPTQDGEYGGSEFMADPIADPGTLTIEYQFDEDDPPPRDEDDFEITMRKRAGKAIAGKIVGRGFVTGSPVNFARGDVVRETVTIKLTGIVRVVGTAS